MRTMPSSPTPVCTPERIRALCGPAAQEVVIETIDETGSTNADLLARLALKAPHCQQMAPRHLLLAHNQTAGRGRAGRSWLASREGSLTFSLAWKFQRRVQDLVGLPLAIGVAIAEAMAHFQIEVQLKWPNDVLRQGKKLAGVLIETSASTEPQQAAIWAVIGIGINIHVPDDLADRIGQPVAHMSAGTVQRDLLMASLLDGLAQAMNLFEEQGFAAFAARWNALHAHAGQEVVMLDHGRVLHAGRAVGVDDIGRLLLDSAGGRIAVMAGDVSLRAAEAP